MAWISAYGCTSAAGPSTEDLWQGLMTGRDHSRHGAYTFPEPGGQTKREILLHQLLLSWRQLPPAVQTRLRTKKMGLIFASTKGFIDDVIWKESPPSEDTMAGLMRDFSVSNELTPWRSMCVSNACASSLSALFLARQWMDLGSVDQVLVIAGDVVGPFAQQGFQSLRVLTAEKTKPFAADRSGFFLGEGTAAIVITKSREPGAIQLVGVGIDAEGFAVTRPSQSGDGLSRAIIQAFPPGRVPAPDGIVAHGTATQVNDAVEDQVFYDLFFKNSLRPTITASKWSVGHSLGVSGALDLIAACEILRRQQIFSIANSSKPDPRWRCQYLMAGQTPSRTKFQQLLVTSLGFGGIHAAAVLQASSP